MLSFPFTHGTVTESHPVLYNGWRFRAKVHVGITLCIIDEAVVMHTNAYRGVFGATVELWSLMQKETE